MSTIALVPSLEYRAAVAPSSYNAREHTVEVVWSTGSRRLVERLFEEPFVEELGLEPDEVDLSRLNDGAPLLEAHGRATHRAGGSSLFDQIGVVVRAWTTGTEGHAIVRFSQRPDVLARGIEQDVAAGNITKVSIGYQVHTYRDVTGPGDSLPVRRAVAWTPFEVSFLPIQEDAGASVRSVSLRSPCLLLGATEARTMDTPANYPTAAAPATHTPTAPIAGGAQVPTWPQPPQYRAPQAPQTLAPPAPAPPQYAAQLTAMAPPAPMQPPSPLELRCAPMPMPAPSSSPPPPAPGPGGTVVLGAPPAFATAPPQQPPAPQYSTAPPVQFAPAPAQPPPPPTQGVAQPPAPAGSIVGAPQPSASYRSPEQATILPGPAPAPAAQAYYPASPAPQATAPPTPASPPLDVRAVTTEALRDERERVAGIEAAFRTVDLPAEAFDREGWTNYYVRSGHTADAARSAALELISSSRRTAPPSSGIHVGTEDAQRRFDAMANALEVRVGLTAADENGRHRPVQLIAGNPYGGMTLLRLAEEVLTIRGVSVAGLNSNALAVRALGTSDFPAILENVANKTLRSAYQATPRTFRTFSRQISVPDFKPVSRVQFGSLALEEIAEDGEVRLGKVSDAKESYALSSYGKRLPLTRRAVVNDDTDAFDRIPRMFGQASANTESDIAWALLTSNVVMSDGFALFSTEHGNDDANVLDEAGLSTGRAKMRKQTDLDGERISVVPAFLMVSPDLETTAAKLTTQVTPASSGDVSVFQSFFDAVLVEPRITSATSWFMSARPGVPDTLEYGYLAGEAGPRIERMEGWETDGVQWRVLHDFLAGVPDHRGLYRGNV